MIFKAGNGAQIIDKIMINEDEALREYPFINHALVIVKSEDDYLFGYHKWRDDWETCLMLHGVWCCDRIKKNIFL